MLIRLQALTVKKVFRSCGQVATNLSESAVTGSLARFLRYLLDMRLAKPSCWLIMKANKQNQKGSPAFENRRARRNYEISETVEAGIVLTGSEVKSLRGGHAEIADAHVLPRQGELFLVNFRIQPYVNAGSFNHEEMRSRKLLLRKKEIERLAGRIRERRQTLVPLKVFFNSKGFVKVLLGLGRGKQKADRREDEKRTEARREMERALRAANR